MKKISLFKTYLPPNTTRRIKEVIDSGWVGCGPETVKFEKIFAEKFEAMYPIATNSCTSALHLAYVLAGVGPGDEVITPVFTCTATNVPILYVGGKIVFADVNPNTLNIDPVDIRRKITSKTKAIVVVHWGGYPAEMDEILSIAKKHKLKVIVDAAHALGSKYHGRDITHYGDYICYSFQAIKQITTIEGGMLVVRNKKDYDRANKLRWYGIDRLADRDTTKRYEEFSDLGFRYIPNDVFMAIGSIQLKENLSKVIKHRRKLAKIYYELLQDHSDVRLIKEDTKNFSTYWLMTVFVTDRPKFRKLLEKHGIATGMAHFRNDISPVLASKRCTDLIEMDAVENHYVCLPIHMGVTEDDVKFICTIINGEYHP